MTGYRCGCVCVAGLILEAYCVGRKLFVATRVPLPHCINQAVLSLFTHTLAQPWILINFAYRMDRLCGGAREISGIKAPLFLRGGVVGPHDTPHHCQKLTWGHRGASDTPHDTPMLFFGNFVKKPDHLSL